MKCIVANVEMTSYKFYEKYYLCLYIKFTLKQQGQRKHFGMFGSRYMGRGSFQNHFLKSIKPHNLANDVGILLKLALKKKPDFSKLGSTLRNTFIFQNVSLTYVDKRHLQFACEMWHIHYNKQFPNSTTLMQAQGKQYPKMEK